MIEKIEHMDYIGDIYEKEDALFYKFKEVENYLREEHNITDPNLLNQLFTDLDFGCLFEDSPTTLKRKALEIYVELKEDRGKD